MQLLVMMGTHTNCQRTFSRSGNLMRGRLNIFQETMLHWNDLHPYNAVHVVRIPGTPDPGRLAIVVNQTLDTLGLARLTIDRDGGRFLYESGVSPVEIKNVPAAGDCRQALAGEIESQLNLQFDWQKPFCPFRFFIVAETGGFFFGLVYFHAVADAEAIVLLLKRLAEGYAGVASGKDWPAPNPPLELHPPRRDRLLWRRPVLFLRKLATLPAHIRNMRSTARPRYTDANDSRIGFTLFTLSMDELSALLQAARQWDVTVNDLLLALLFRALVPFAASRKPGSKRSNLSVGCIVNARSDAGLSGGDVFGLFLGSFTVTHAVPEGIGLRELARDIRTQTGQIKRHKLYLGAAMEMAFARRTLSFYSTERRRKLYQKNYPLWGGVTNMNLNSLWPQPEGVWDYFRAVSTGPVTPLVLSVTTAGDHANVGLSHRTTVFSTADVERLKASLVQSISQMETPA